MSPHTDPGAPLKLAEVKAILTAHLKIGGNDAWEGHYYFVDGINSAAEEIVVRQAASHGSAGGERSEVHSDTAIVEALGDVKSHARAWRGAIADKCTPFGSDDDGSYWDHELRAFDRTVAALAVHPVAPAQAQQVWPKEIRSLVNEIAGVWDAFELGLRQEISNTNYAVVREKLSAVENLIASPVPSAHQSAPSDSSSLPSGESDPSATMDFLGAGTGDNAAPYGNGPREIQKRAMKARTSAISSAQSGGAAK